MICLYKNAKLDARYVYGAPVKFSSDPAVIAQRMADKAAMESRARKENTQ